MKLRYLLVLFGWAMLTGAQASHLQVSLDDIVLLSQQGVSDQTILLFLDNREVGFALDADALDKLLLAGVSGEVIRYLFSQNTTAQTPAVSEPFTTPGYATSSNPVISYPTVPYVDNYPGYYYTPYYYGGFYSFGFSSYPHRWFGHYARGGHRTTNAHHSRRQHVVHYGHSNSRHSNRHDDHSAPNTGRHYGTHTGSSSISHRSQHETIRGGDKQHTTSAGNRHGMAGVGQTKSYHTKNFAHGSSHVVANSGRSHIGKSSHSNRYSSGRGHKSSGRHSFRRSGHSGRGHRGGGHSGGHGGGHGGGH